LLLDPFALHTDLIKGDVFLALPLLLSFNVPCSFALLCDLHVDVCVFPYFLCADVLHPAQTPYVYHVLPLDGFRTGTSAFFLFGCAANALLLDLVFLVPLAVCIFLGSFVPCLYVLRPTQTRMSVMLFPSMSSSTSAFFLLLGLSLLGALLLDLVFPLPLLQSVFFMVFRSFPICSSLRWELVSLISFFSDCPKFSCSALSPTPPIGI
jgi:hypothetical protein